MMIGISAALQAARQRSGSPSSPAAYRYWRVQNLVVAGTYFEISELQMCVGGVRQSGAISVSTPGGYSNVGLINDNNLNTREFWPIVSITPDFWIAFDFATPVAVDGVRQGGFDTSNRIATLLDVYASADGSSWLRIGSVGPMTYPGNNTLSPVYPIA